MSGTTLTLPPPDGGSLPLPPGEGDGPSRLFEHVLGVLRGGRQAHRVAFDLGDQASRQVMVLGALPVFGAGAVVLGELDALASSRSTICARRACSARASPDRAAWKRTTPSPRRSSKSARRRTMTNVWRVSEVWAASDGVSHPKTRHGGQQRRHEPTMSDGVA